MNPNLDKAQTIFFAAIEKHSPEQWPGYLSEACADNVELRARVEQLLAAHLAMGSIHGSVSPLTDATIDRPLTERPGATIGPYKLLQVIGEGGMGMVYMAEQTVPVERRVALKIIKPGMDSRQVIARFEAERQALAMMDHQNIAKVLEAGTTESGRPYFVMELVKGIPITKYCDEKHLSLKERLELMIPVCQAIQHAHQKGIIHRDIKPTNVLVAQYDGKPVPKVIDFGVAKATAQKLTERTMFTELGQIVGTLEYMSPEQAELNQLDIDTRSDIYSLGVLLYELLTGSTPFDKHKLRTAAFAEMLRIIREDEPPKPSTKLSTIDTLPSVAANRSVEPTRLSKSIRGELDWIVMKALEKDRNRRYETANGFASDIQRYLSDEQVHACPPSANYRLGKFVRKNRTALSTAATVTAALIIGTAVSTWQAVRALRAERLAHVNESQARAAAAAESTAKQAEAIQREQAQKNFESALEAVDRLLAHIGSDELFEIPHVQPVRRKILQDALEFYERLQTQSDNAPGVRHRLGRTLTRMAYSVDELGEPDTACRFYDAGVEIMARLVAEFPDRMDFRSTLADCCAEAARFYSGNGPAFSTRAEELFTRAIELYAMLSEAGLNPTEETPYSSGSFANRRVNALVRLSGVRPAEEDKLKLLTEAFALGESAGDSTLRAQVDARLGRARLEIQSAPERADEWYRQAIALHRKWSSANKRGQGRLEKSIYANLLRDTGRHLLLRHPAEAEQLLREAIEIRRAIASGFASNPYNEYSLICCLRPLVWILRKHAKDQSRIRATPESDRLRNEANTLMEEAIAAARRMVKPLPCAVRYRDLFAATLEEQSRDLSGPNSKRCAEQPQLAANWKVQAKALLMEAIQIRRELVADFPDDPNFSVRLTTLLDFQAQHLGQKTSTEQPMTDGEKVPAPATPVPNPQP